MKEGNNESHSPKSDVKSKKEWTLEYLIGTLVIAIIYGVVTSSLDLVSILGALIPLALIAGVITFFNKGKYVKNLFWTSLVIMTISSFGQLSLEEKENKRINAPYIDKLIKETKEASNLPMDGEFAKWVDLFNESNESIVFTYTTDVGNKNELIDLIYRYQVDKSSQVERFKENDYEFTRQLVKRDVNLVFRYYYRDNLLYEITISSDDW